MSGVRAVGVPALVSVVVNAVLFGAALWFGWFDGVVASQNDEALNVAFVVVATLVGVAGLLVLRWLLVRWRGPVGGRRTFLIVSFVIFVLSLATPMGGLDGGTAGAVFTLVLTHLVAVIGGVAAADRASKPTWSWGIESYRRRPLPEPPVAFVTGVTGGIGAATALALAGDGFRVVGVGRSAEKAEALQSAATPLKGSVEVLLADMSSMREAAAVGAQMARLQPDGVDAVVHAVGTLKRESSPTVDGIDSNIATSWLSRVQAHRQVVLNEDARVVNVAAAESPATPKRLLATLRSLDDLDTGFVAHGQAQLANDLWVAGLQRRGVTAFGYGPGAVDTDIRRNIAPVLRAMIRPFFWWSTRQPEESAADIVRLLVDADLPVAGGFASRDGLFSHNEHILDIGHQDQIERLADTLLAQASSTT
ncbi:MAG: SDR family NAD(P)-dependent oxidoreductase [Actinomycetota bacterium]